MTVLAATGSVGRRVVRLVAREGAEVRVASRQMVRAKQVCDDLRQVLPGANLQAWEPRDELSLRSALDGAAVVIAAGAPGAELLPENVRREARGLELAIDLNAVPPAGIGGIQPHDKSVSASADGASFFASCAMSRLCTERSEWEERR